MLQDKNTLKEAVQYNSDILWIKNIKDNNLFANQITEK